MALLSAPKAQPRTSHLSAEVKAWKTDEHRTTVETEAFERTLELLRSSQWLAVDLRESTVFREYYHATMPNGDVMILRFGMKSPLAAFFVLFVGLLAVAMEWTPEH